MKIKRLLCLFLLMVFNASFLVAQMTEVEEPSILPPDMSIYISTLGNDQNSGTQSMPVMSFQKAMELIPFNNQKDVYGEIVFQEGDYYPNQALVQKISDSQKEGYRKSISIKGEGIVNIYGDNTPLGSHLVILRGSGISIKNINLFNAKGIALLISDQTQAGVLTNESRITNVLIENVSVDNTISHGIIAQLVKRLKFERVIVTNACQENTDVKGNCQWGSALRTSFCDNVIVKNCEIYHNKGEGINIGTSTMTLVESNVSYDNFSANMYCIRTNKAVFRNNLVFNRDSLYWRNCQPDNSGKPQIRKPSAGFAIANEVNYDDFFSEACIPERTFLDGLFVNKISDSIFFYNNILALAPLHITDESSGNCFFSEFSHANNLSNIFIENNTFIGDISLEHDYLNQSPLISMTFNQSYFWGCLFDINGVGKYRTDNIVFQNNIVSSESSWNGEDLNPGFVLYGGRPCNGGILPDKFSSSGNLWHHEPSQIYDSYVSTFIPNFLYGSDNSLDDEMLTSYDPMTTIETLIPDENSNGNHFVKKTKFSSYITKDYLGNDRDPDKKNLTNVGALEIRQHVSIDELDSQFAIIKVFPNPTTEEVHITTSDVSFESSCIEVFNSVGQIINCPIKYFADNYLIVDLGTYENGIYYIKVINNYETYLNKIMKVD